MSQDRSPHSDDLMGDRVVGTNDRLGNQGVNATNLNQPRHLDTHEGEDNWDHNFGGRDPPELRRDGDRPAVHRNVYNDGGGFDLSVVRPRGAYSDYGANMGGEHGIHGKPGTLGPSREECIKENLPPCLGHELEFIVPDATGHQIGVPVRSASKTVGNFRFRILVFPSGTQSSQGNQVSAFVEADPQEDLDPRWIFHSVKYQITMINWLDYRRSVTKADNWSFSKDGIDRGWHDMVRTADLTPDAGWVNDQGGMYFRACCYVRQADSINVSSDCNFKKETGYVGLKNHGATCYMNGLLQSLFHVGQFREIVYSIDCHAGGCDGEDDDVGDGGEAAPSVIQALQNVFYKLQTSDQAVPCRELMKSFGWDTTDAFTQHDAQELNRILCDRLEEQMKGTPMDGSIKKLFEGEMENYIQCCDIDYKSTRSETFYDIQLNIKCENGAELRTIEESLKDFTEEETLEGDNAYEAEGHGKQRAKKGIKFKRFPPVLNIQLKRFHFDLEKLDMVKLNTRFEFKTTLDLSDFAPGAGNYLLHAVVVHSGDVNSGHYYALIKPTPESGWVKFDDDTVTPCSEYAAVEDNYGGQDLVIWNYFDRTPRELRVASCPTRPRIHNAYMLVYVREDVASTILRVPDPKSTNLRMVDRFDREVQVAEKRKREKMEQQMKIKIRLVFEVDLMKMTGFWDHQELPHSQTLKMSRDQPIKELMQEVEALCDVPMNHLAFFGLHYRSNPRQVRFVFLAPNSTLKSHIPAYNAPHFDLNDPYLVILAVASRGYELDPQENLGSGQSPTGKSGDGVKVSRTMGWNLGSQKPTELSRWHADDTWILLIVKYYCPANRKIVTLGCYYTEKKQALIAMVNDHWVQDRVARYVEAKEVAPIPEDSATNWECWEEFSERDIQMRNTKRTLNQEQLWSGDVIIWQLCPKDDHKASPTDTRTSLDGGEAPQEVPEYAVNTVADLAVHQANSIDVTVTVHDSHQPLSVDGVVANGTWGPCRPQSATDDKKEGAKKERVDDPTLTASTCQFQMPHEKDLKMDLRWHLHHMTATIAKTFGLEVPENVWLFHSVPSASPDEPLNSHVTRNEQTTLKDVQRNISCITTSQSKKSLAFHAVELPYSPAKMFERNMCSFCIRFYDDAVREVGNTIVLVPSSGTAQDVIEEAKKAIKPEWGLRVGSGAFRLMEVIDCRLHKVYQPNTPVRSFLCLSKMNILFNSLRLEIDTEAYGGEDSKLIEVYHSDRSSGTAFGQPFLVTIAAGERAGNLKQRLKTKLRVPEGEFKNWRLLRSVRQSKNHLKDDDEVFGDGGEEPLPPDALDKDPQGAGSELKVVLEHSHPSPGTSLNRQARYNKPLTIK